MKIKVERKEDESPRKMQPAERAARFADQQKRLVGMTLVDELECSNSLCDLVQQQSDENALLYVPP